MKQEEINRIKEKLWKEAKNKTTPEFTFRQSLIDWAVEETIRELNIPPSKEGLSFTWKEARSFMK